MSVCNMYVKLKGNDKELQINLFPALYTKDYS